MTNAIERRSLIQAAQLTTTQKTFIRSGRDPDAPLVDTPPGDDGPSDSINVPAIVDDFLVPITTKLRRRTYQALRRAYLQQKLRQRQPATQQEIVEYAVVEWLSRNGFSLD